LYDSAKIWFLTILSLFVLGLGCAASRRGPSESPTETASTPPGGANSENEPSVTPDEEHSDRPQTPNADPEPNNDSLFALAQAMSKAPSPDHLEDFSARVGEATKAMQGGYGVAGPEGYNPYPGEPARGATGIGSIHRAKAFGRTNQPSEPNNGPEAAKRLSANKTAIKLVMLRHTGQIRACYTEALRKRPRLEGRVRVQFLVKNDGLVAWAKVETSSLNDASADRCLITTIRGIPFPPLAGKGMVNAIYPFTFENVGSSKNGEADDSR